MENLKQILPKILCSYIENHKIVEIGYILLNFKDFWCALCGEGITLSWNLKCEKAWFQSYGMSQCNDQLSERDKAVAFLHLYRPSTLAESA